MKEIIVSEEFKIPGTNSILEKGDRVVIKEAGKTVPLPETSRFLKSLGVKLGSDFKYAKRSPSYPGASDFEIVFEYVLPGIAFKDPQNYLTFDSEGDIKELKDLLRNANVYIKYSSNGWSSSVLSSFVNTILDGDSKVSLKGTIATHDKILGIYIHALNIFKKGKDIPTNVLEEIYGVVSSFGSAWTPFE